MFIIVYKGSETVRICRLCVKWIEASSTAADESSGKCLLVDRNNRVNSVLVLMLWDLETGKLFAVPLRHVSYDILMTWMYSDFYWPVN